MYSYQQTKLIVLAIVAMFSVTLCGCIAPSETNVSLEEIYPSLTQVSASTIHQSPFMSLNDTQNAVSINATQSPKPFFTFNTRSSIDNNGNVILSEYQAWIFAEDYLETNKGFLNINPEEVAVRGPKKVIGGDTNQTMIWTFEIHRKDPMGFERGGILAVDAYNGDIIWFAAFT